MKCQISQILQMRNITFFFIIIAFFLARQSSCSCLAKQYFDSNTSLCKNCFRFCNSCVDDVTCTVCASGYFLNNPNNCQKQRDDSLTRGSIIAGICFGVLLIVIGVCLCVRKCLERHTQARVHNEINQPDIQFEPPSQQQLHFDETKTESEGLQFKKEEPCPFCLDPEVNLQIPCSHLYHLQCMSRWFTRHNDCPICKRNVIGEAKLYCSKCFRCHISFCSALIASNRIAKKWVCQKCKELQKQQTKNDFKQIQ